MAVNWQGTATRALGFLFLILFAGEGIAASEVRPWCDEPGVATHPLSVERLSETGLFRPEVYSDIPAALGIIRDAFIAAQRRLRDEGRISEYSPQANALLRNIEAQIRGENKKPFFAIQTLPDGDELLSFGGGVPKLRYDCEKDTPEQITDPQKANIAYAAYAVNLVLDQNLSVLDRIYAVKVGTRAAQYEAYMTNGLPMWPWELAINSWGEDYDDLLKGPPRWQWVVMRPSAGLEIFWPNRRDAELEASVAIEPIGFVRYTDLNTYKEWWGLSALVTLGSADNGVGLGGLIRYNNYALGIVRREDIDDAYVFLSFDLYEQVRETRVRVEEAKAKLEELKKVWAKP